MPTRTTPAAVGPRAGKQKAWGPLELSTGDTVQEALVCDRGNHSRINQIGE